MLRNARSDSLFWFHSLAALRIQIALHSTILKAHCGILIFGIVPIQLWWV